MADYSKEWDDFDKKYCYPNSYVLINKATIQDEAEAKAFETAMSTIRIEQAKSKPIIGEFDFKHLLSLHKFIFQDVFTWAGKPRTVDLSKDGTQFCLAVHISEYSRSVFEEILKDGHMLTESQENVCEKLAKHLADINSIHTFREGNGRTQRLFVEYQANIAGFSINPTKDMHDDMVLASKVSLSNNNSLLEKIYKSSISPISIDKQREFIKLVSPKILKEFDLLYRQGLLPDRIAEFKPYCRNAGLTVSDFKIRRVFSAPYDNMAITHGGITKTYELLANDDNVSIRAMMADFEIPQGLAIELRDRAWESPRPHPELPGNETPELIAGKAKDISPDIEDPEIDDDGFELE